MYNLFNEYFVKINSIVVAFIFITIIITLNCRQKVFGWTTNNLSQTIRRKQSLKKISAVITQRKFPLKKGWWWEENRNFEKINLRSAAV